MKKSRSGPPDPKVMLRQARKLAAKGADDRALDLFSTVIRQYLDQGFELKALASAKVAKTVLGSSPRAEAMLIRLYSACGLHADARAEFQENSARFNIDRARIFDGLSRDEFIDFLDIFDIVTVRKGARVFRQGQEGQDIYLLAAGSLEVIHDGTHVSCMHAGDVFGEIGFFTHAARTATVTALENSTVVRLDAGELHRLCRSYPGVARALDTLYTTRMLRKALEEAGPGSLLDLHQDSFSEKIFPRGEEIRLDAQADLCIVKHGVIEINYSDKGLNRKQFLGPGSVFNSHPGQAHANTDVRIIAARIDLLPRRPD